MHPHQRSAGSQIDSVFVVKSETRSGDTGHPLVNEPTISVWEGYRTKDGARVAMVEIANRTAAFEIARAGHRPSPATLNVIPSADDMIDSLEVLSADGMIYRFFIDSLPIAG